MRSSQVQDKIRGFVRRDDIREELSEKLSKEEYNEGTSSSLLLLSFLSSSLLLLSFLSSSLLLLSFLSSSLLLLSFLSSSLLLLPFTCCLQAWIASSCSGGGSMSF